ncbi:MAG TPA: Crp/Fnr family transcriptional regulator, partial [Usitatibacter sp.]|nr:Crp/Fnr family transcriptional regulator [Usitatibacter sp.]
AGDTATHFTIIQTGLVEIRRPTPSGEGAIMGLFGPHESVGDFAVLERGTFPADAIAISETLDVLRVRADPVLEALERDAELARAIRTSLMEHFRMLRAKIDVMSAGAVPNRLAMLLMHLVERFGDELEDGSVCVAITLSRGQLARLVGARTETVIRTMTKWQREGWVETSNEGMSFRSTEPLKLLVESPI